MSLSDQLRLMMGQKAVAKPGLKPVVKPPLVGSLVERLKANAAAAPARPNVIKQATDKLVAAGRFIAPAEDHKPVVTLLEPKPVGTGLFARIGQAGPKKRQQSPEQKEKVQKLSLRLLQEMGKDVPLDRTSKLGKAFRATGVMDSPELDRIVGLPRRVAVFEEYEDLTEKFRRPGATMTIWSVQNAMLHEAKKSNGLLGAAAAGSGKTLVSLLVGSVMDAKRIVLLVPPQLRAQLLTKDIPRLNKEFYLPLDRLNVVSYSELSSAKSADVLEQLKPDLIVADEAHCVKSRSAARTKRFLRYFKDHPNCRFVGLSGTITRRSLRDFAHLCELSLRARSPLPHNFHTLTEFSEAIDISKDPLPAGQLRRLCTSDEVLALDSEDDPLKAQQIVRTAFRRRFIETPGIIATQEGAVGTSLVISGLKPSVPVEVQRALEALRTSWCLGEDELVDILSVIRAGCQLSTGFYTKWDWPGGIPDREWLEARSNWNKELREVLKLSRKGLDSPLQVTNAVLRGELESDFYATWAEVKTRYNPEPPRATVWISDFLVQQAVHWGKTTCDKSHGGIIWFQHRALGEAIAKLGGFPFFGGGDEASKELTEVTPKKSTVIVCSQKAHGTGTNLQAYCRSLFTTPPAGLEAEQTIARQHRFGQEADQVDVDIYVHTEEMQRSFLNSLRDARYVQTTSGQKQKLLYAERIGLPEEDE